MRNDQLEPINPEKAVELYLEKRKEDASYETRRTLSKGLELFVEWAGYAGVDNMNTVRGRELLAFKNWCKDNSDNNTVSLNGLLSVLRRFLVFCVDIEAVGPAVPNKTPIPNVPDDEDVNYEKPSDKEVEQIAEFLELHEPYSRRRIEFELIREIGLRVGAVRAIDERDLDLEEQVIRLRHRPADDPEVKGTPLKNKKDGERNINISERLAELIEGYWQSPKRHDVTDKFGRKPLLTTKEGRPRAGTIQRDIYKLTRPCVYGNNCPHDRDVTTCEATKSASASKCPSSQTPHPVRRWSIERQIDVGVAKELLCDRVDVSVPVLNKHYDTRTKERKREHRLRVYEKLFDGYGDPEATLDMEELADALIDEDGMIDPQALLRLQEQDEPAEIDQADESVPTVKSVNETTTEETPDGSNTEEEEEEDEDQLSLGEFGIGPTGVFGPGTAVLAGCTAGSARTVDRVHRELDAMSPGTDGVATPSKQRAATGTAAYALYVVLVAVNFALLGIPSA